MGGWDREYLYSEFYMLQAIANGFLRAHKLKLDQDTMYQQPEPLGMITLSNHTGKVSL